MNQIKTLIATLILVYCIPVAGFAQDFKADLEKMYEAYKTFTHFSVKVNIKIYELETSTQPAMIHNAHISRDNNNFLITMNGYTMLYTDTLGLNINTEAKTITCSPYYPGDIKPALAITGLDSLLKQIDSVKYRGTVNATKHYTIFTTKKLIKQSEIYFSSVNHTIAQIIYQYNYELIKQHTKVIIDYSEFNTAPKFPAGYFSLAKYVVFGKDKIKPASGYKDYEIQLNF